LTTNGQACKPVDHWLTWTCS